MPVPKTTFQQLQNHLRKNPYLTVATTDKERTLVYLAGFSLDQEELDKIVGMGYYEERLLYVIGLLRNPKTKIIFVTSRQVDPIIIEYYFDLFSRSKVERSSMVKRWHNFYVGNAKVHKTLTQKVLHSQRLCTQIKNKIIDSKRAVLRCFNVSQAEHDLAEKLGIPLFASHPNLLHLGSKSGSRKIFKQAKLPLSYGKEDIHSIKELVYAIHDIKKKFPTTKRVITKLDHSFSGGGNAILDIQKFPRTVQAAQDYIKKHIKLIETGMSRHTYLEKFSTMGGIVEIWIEGGKVHSPSVQVKIHPSGQVEILSTHEQLFDEKTGQVYLGARYPSRPSLRKYLLTPAEKIAKVLAKQEVIGYFSIDFIVVKKSSQTQVYPIEINLRKTGTTHPYQIARLVTNSQNTKQGMLRDHGGKKVYYYAFDNIKSKQYVGLTPHDIIRIVREAGLEFDPKTNTGITLHLLGAVKKYGKFGAVCIARSPKAAEQLFVLLKKVLNSKTTKVAEPKLSTDSREVIVNRQQVIDTFVQLAKISSPSGKEQEIRLLLREQLVKLGVTTRVDKAGNLLGKKAGVGSVPLLLSAHMDTVEPCTKVNPVVRGNTIMSDGSSILGADNKAGITYILEALRILQKYNIPHVPLEIALSVKEEVFSGGADHIDIAKFSAPFGLVLDGAELGEVDYISPYIAIVNVTIAGKAAHSGVEPEKGISAIQIAATAIHHMKLGRLDKATTANIGLIQGGTIRNAIPDKVELAGEVRSISKRKLEEQIERMYKALEDASEKYGGLLDIQSKIVVHGYEFSKADKDLKDIMHVMRSVGIKPNLRQAGGGSDANVFVNKGIKTIDIGTGVQKPHTVEERINIDDMVKMVQFVLAMVKVS